MASPHISHGSPAVGETLGEGGSSSGIKLCSNDFLRFNNLNSDSLHCTSYGRELFGEKWSHNMCNFQRLHLLNKDHECHDIDTLCQKYF